MEPARLPGIARADSGAAASDTVVYVEPIYIQASEARMPQLKKVAMAMGNRLIYADTYEQALQQLGGASSSQSSEREPGSQASTATAQATSSPPGTAPSDVLQTIREHLRRYRELSAQGKWAEAGKELEAVEAASRQQ